MQLPGPQQQQPGPQQCSCQELSNAAAGTSATTARSSAMQLPGPQQCSCQDLSYNSQDLGNAAAGTSATAARASESSQDLSNAAARSWAMQLPGAQARSTNQGSGWGSHPSHEGLGPPQPPSPGLQLCQSLWGGGAPSFRWGVGTPPPCPPCLGPQLYSLSGKILAWKPFPQTSFSRLLTA